MVDVGQSPDSPSGQQPKSLSTRTSTSRCTLDKNHLYSSSTSTAPPSSALASGGTTPIIDDDNRRISAAPTTANGSQRDALQLILDKIPVQAQSEHWVATLHNEFRRAIRSGGEMPWTQEGLCDEIIDNLKRSATIKPRAQVAQRPPTGPAPKSGDGGARASRLKDKVLTGTVGKWLGETRSFCFIKIKNEKDSAFCHKNSIIGDKLEEGTEVQLKLVYDIPATAKRGEERREYAT